MYQESMVEIAYRYLKDAHEAVRFKQIWDHVAKSLEYDENKKIERVSLFYTELSLDGRFVTLGENTWDLREHHTYDKVHIDMNDIYAEVEDISALDEDELIDFPLLDEIDRIDEDEDYEEEEKEEEPEY